MKFTVIFALARLNALAFGGFLLFSFLLFKTPAHAATGPQDWTTRVGCVKPVTVKLSPALGSVTYNDVASIQGIECLFFNVLQVVVVIAGLAFLFMFISGGFKYLFSSNEQKSVAAASSTLTMAIIGLVGIIVSWLILSFIEKFTGVKITQFKIPG